MSQVSRPLLAALLAAVVFLAVWLVALKPSSQSASGSPAATTMSASGLLSAPGKARGAVAASDAASAKHSGTVATAPSASTPTHTGTLAATTPATTTSPAAPIQGSTSAAQPQRKTAPRSSGQRLDAVSRALKDNKVLALLFYNPAGADDGAVRQELAAIPSGGGRVFEQAIPITELANYPVVTLHVPVTTSPTLVVIDPDQKARTIVGFADGFEIAQRVADALAVA
jgi:hypothetical protein